MKHFVKVRIIVFFLFISNTFIVFSQTEPIFEIKNDAGQTVFAVYPGGVKIFVEDQLKATGGGFTVGRLSTGKAAGDDIFSVNFNDVRVNIDESTGLKATGGGFTVGRLSTGKAVGGDIFTVQPNDVKVILDQPTGLKATGGGFTVGRLSTGKATGGNENFLTVTPDSTRVYIDSSSTAGFAVGKIGSTSGLQNFMYLKKDNYFIGHNSGKLTTGLYNLFLGYESGFSNTSGYNNVFIGKETGYTNSGGYNNVFMGNSTAKSTSGSNQNVAIGNNCAFDVSSTITSSVIMGDNALTSMLANIPVTNSMFIGKNAGINIGEASSYVSDCIFLGTNAGDGIKNTQYSSISSIVAIGNSSGKNSDGYRNVFIGNSAGSEFVGHQNTMIGFSVGTQGGSGTYNVFIGDQVALKANGDNNTYMGRTAGCWVNGSNNVFLGYNAGRAAWDAPRTESNRLRIGSSNLIYGEFDNNRVAINTSDANGKTFWVNGSAGGTEGWNQTSDRRLKTSIETIPNALEKVKALRGVNFYWKDKKKRGKKLQIGFIAQETINTLPEVVSKTSETYSMQYAPITAVLVEAVKEQQKIIERLESRIDQLENKNESLSAKVSEIDNMKSEINELKTLMKALVEVNQPDKNKEESAK